jgi:hypothetical protein
MSPRPVGTRRPRLLPGALLASGLVVAAACTALAITEGPSRQSMQTCATGQEWVTVTVNPVVVGVYQWDAARAVSAVEPPTLAGCVDTRHLTPKPNTHTDSRG